MFGRIPLGSKFFKLSTLFLLFNLSVDNISLAQKPLGDDWAFYYDQSRAIYATDIMKAIAYAEKAKDIAFELEDVEAIGKSHWMLGWLHMLNGDLVNGFNYYLGARKAYLRLEDWDKLEQIEENLGSIAMDNRSYSTAIKRWEQRLETAKRIDERRIASAYFDLGLAYKNDGQADKAAEYQMKARVIYENYYEREDSLNLARVYNEIGILFSNAIQSPLDQQNKDSALIYFRKALDMDNGAIMRAMVNNNRGVAFRKAGLLDEAIEEFKIALTINSGAENERLLMSNLTNLGEVFYLKNALDSCMIYFGDAINIEYSTAISNNASLNAQLEFDMSEYLIKAVLYIDSIKTGFPNYISGENYLAVLNTVSRLKLNMDLLENINNQDLIELASREYEDEVKKELIWANTKFWSAIIFCFVIGCFLIYKILEWILLKRAVKSQLAYKKVS